MNAASVHSDLAAEQMKEGTRLACDNLNNQPLNGSSSSIIQFQADKRLIG